MIAMLGMYDMPAVQGANDRFWRAIRTRLGFGPDNLVRGTDFWQTWTSDDLLLSQTCGLPYRTRLHQSVRLVGTPDYGLPDCPPGYYNSVIVRRANADDCFEDVTLAYNEVMSQSGWAAPMAHFAQRSVKVTGYLETGSHAGSAQAVVQGRADVAGIDALTWQLLCEHDPVVSNLKVVDTTAPTPGLPMITAMCHDADQIARAVLDAIDDMAAVDRDRLHLRGLINIPKEQYLAIPNPPAP